MAKSEGTGRSPSLRTTIERRSYVLMRLSELADTVKAHGSERSDLTKIKTMPNDSGSDLKKLRDRRAYLARRIEVLREEQKTLQTQRREINQEVAQMSKGGRSGGSAKP
jgi:chromosome segregation ATPase